MSAIALAIGRGVEAVRLRRVSIQRETDTDIVGAVLPKGYLRPATQGIWQQVMRDTLDAAMLRSDWHSTLHAVATKLMFSADWDSLTTRPTWPALIDYCQRTTGHGSRSAIARAIATLIELKLIARVAHGRSAEYSPSHTTTNEAAVYVLLVPANLVALPRRVQPVDESGTPPWQGNLSEAQPTHAREDDQAEPLRGTQTNVAAQAPPRPSPGNDRNVPLWPGWATTGSDAAMLLAAAELRRRLPVLRTLSDADLKFCLKPFWFAGWSVDDVHHALDWRPDQTRWPHPGATGIGADTNRIRSWIAYRLAPWTSDGTPRLSFSQRAQAERAEEIARRRARDQREAAERAARGPRVTVPPPVYLAARAHLRHLRLRTTDPTCGACTTVNDQRDG